MLVEADVAVDEGAVDAVAIGLRQPRALGFGQRHELHRFAGARPDRFELVAESGNELLGHQCYGHENSLWVSYRGREVRRTIVKS
ncbi:MAG: hypothetical protein EBY83_03435 [Verrucomicrobia bacterium]|nr:hypothetical protein [Verrucomicrobiota bacterium]